MKAFHKSLEQGKSNGFREKNNPFNEKDPLIVRTSKTTSKLFYRKLAMFFALAVAIVFLSPTCGKKQPLNQSKYSKPHIIINRKSPESAESSPPKRRHKNTRFFKTLPNSSETPPKTPDESSKKSKSGSKIKDLRCGEPSPLPRSGL